MPLPAVKEHVAAKRDKPNDRHHNADPTPAPRLACANIERDHSTKDPAQRLMTTRLRNPVDYDVCSRFCILVLLNCKNAIASGTRVSLLTLAMSRPAQKEGPHGYQSAPS
jgi:hypothetical protein